MKKTWIYLLLTCFLLVSVCPGQALAAANFSDIKNSWAKDSILRLAALGHVSGYPDGKFRPDNSMTRAEFTSALMACVGVTTGDATTKYFTDVNQHWAKARINEAVKRGILVPSEYPNGLKPDQSIKRSEAAAMLVRALGEKADNGTLPPFEDRAEVEKSSYKGFIKKAFDLGLMSGYPGGKFEPFGNMTRAQVCTVLSSFLDKKGTLSPNPGLNPIVSGSIGTIAIGDELFKLGTSPLIIRSGMTDIAVLNLSVSSGYLVVNGQYAFKLDVSTNNPDIVVNNVRYKVNKLTIAGDKLVVYPSSQTIYTVSTATHKYNAEFVKIYINSANSSYYLADMQIIDKQTVKIDGRTYDLLRDRITLELGSSFFDIKGISYSTGDTQLLLYITDPVIKKGLSLSDVSAIFAGTYTLNLNNIHSIDFIIDGKRYRQSEVTIDANGNFSYDQKTYSASQVTMIVDGTAYKINNIAINNHKFIFYCSESTFSNWVVINDVYRDADEVKILKDNVIYDLDQIMVVSTNVIRIGGKQYKLDASFKCRYDNKVYAIDRIEYDSRLQTNVLKTSESNDAYLSNQPIKYIFYNNNRKYMEGIDDTVLIKVGGNWISFSKILIPDPAHFTYGNKTYDLIGAQVRIDKTDFIVTDTSWHGRTQLLDIHIY
ncbi:S-layer homology domain [Syntrophomonas zehnderi OL-4]|uniref:S-layer homology domain n=1 Tax=Syntrophomonas zehnderi OL-4 TaxID=690567 RepID=A0A0E4GC18_9FIRM|nr:S-layer homology domain-containing protein [Syntrophomonas zehnderi]CFX01971.1 S-layer homology domain [Syntrophomonas zehnderi OL-4]